MVLQYQYEVLPRGGFGVFINMSRFTNAGLGSLCGVPHVGVQGHHFCKETSFKCGLLLICLMVLTLIQHRRNKISIVLLIMYRKKDKQNKVPLEKKLTKEPTKFDKQYIHLGYTKKDIVYSKQNYLIYNKNTTSSNYITMLPHKKSIKHYKQNLYHHIQVMDNIIAESEPTMVNSLNFGLTETAQYITERRHVNCSPSGSNVYNPNAGDKKIRCHISGEDNTYIDHLLLGYWPMFKTLTEHEVIFHDRFVIYHPSSVVIDALI